MSHDEAVWQRHATQWSLVGPPLRPSPADGALLESIASPLRQPDVLVLGVTPEMAGIAWPKGTRLLAMEREPQMIERVWPGYPGPGEGAMLGDWLVDELPAASRDLVVGDGIFTVIDWPEGGHELLRRMHRVLRPGGAFAFRTFIHPDVGESPAQVFEAALGGDIGSFHAFKLRLLMACQPSLAAGIRTGEVWGVFHDTGPGAQALHDAAGWPLEQIATIDAYKGQDMVYHFPTQAQLGAAMTAAGFAQESRQVCGYELAERCPTVVARRR